MTTPANVRIDPAERFPHLQHAPIVEAVIDVRARAEVPWEEEAIQAQIKAQLPDYPQADSSREFRHEVKMAPGQEPQQTLLDLGWKGLRLRSSDKLHIAQFNRDGFVFSRLQPYESWEQLIGEGMRLWGIHREIARPSEVQRLGLRFINRILLPPKYTDFEDYLKAPPKLPDGLDLPFQGFFHNETLAVTGHPYAINNIRTIQPPQPPEHDRIGIILDNDVFTVEPFEFQQEILERRLAEMRWLKNKAFFGIISEKALGTFQ
jgi:uncharacterized protein (TIGR04255 family)